MRGGGGLFSLSKQFPTHPDLFTAQSSIGFRTIISPVLSTFAKCYICNLN